MLSSFLIVSLFKARLLAGSTTTGTTLVSVCQLVIEGLTLKAYMCTDITATNKAGNTFAAFLLLIESQFRNIS